MSGGLGCGGALDGDPEAANEEAEALGKNHPFFEAAFLQDTENFAFAETNLRR